jgi:glycosyltransferase involved in cell wall biosynthesis
MGREAGSMVCRQGIGGHFARSAQSPLVIVSLTPMSLQNDSRTLKQASSVARLGYHSIVVEGLPSALNPPPAFEIISSIRRPRGSALSGYHPAAEEAVRENSGGSYLRTTYWLEPLLESLREKVKRWLPLFLEPIKAVYHWSRYFRLYVWSPLECTPKASLYYLHSWHQFPAVYLLCFWHRAKFVYDAHDFYSNMVSEETLSHFWRCWALPGEKLLERLCVSRASAVVTVNEGIAQLMEQRFGRKPLVLRNSHDERLDQPVSRTIRDVIGIGRDELLFVCIGQWKEGRAVSEAIIALGLTEQNYHLAFLGPGYPPHTELINRHNVSGRVHFLPPVQPTEVVPFVASADAALILYYPIGMTFQHSLPNGFFQSVAAGLPILYPGLPEIRRLAERYGLGVSVDPLDPSSIAWGMRRIGASELRGQIVKNVLNARSAVSWQRDEERLRLLLEDLLVRQAVSGPSRLPS